MMIALTTEFLKTGTQTAFNVLLSTSLNCHVDFRRTFDSGSPFPVLRCILPVPRSPFSFSCFLFPVFCFLFPVSCFLFPVPCSLFPFTCSPFLVEYNPLKSKSFHCLNTKQSNKFKRENIRSLI